MKTLNKEYLGEYKDKGSKFIAYAFPCISLDIFEKKLELLKKEHFKARHHCYAWRFGFLGEEFRANDDGEPSGTAGIPIYNQLLSFEVSNSAIIVVRYFGGTLLGTSGLIKAYKTSSFLALEKAEFLELKNFKKFKVLINYQNLNKFLYLIDKFKIEVIEKNFNQELPEFIIALENKNLEIEKLALKIEEIK